MITRSGREGTLDIVHLAGAGVSPSVPLTIHRTTVIGWNKGKVSMMIDDASGTTREPLTIGDLPG